MSGLASITFYGNCFYSLTKWFLFLIFKCPAFHLNLWFSYYKKPSMAIASSLSSHAWGFTDKLRYREAICPKSLRKPLAKWRTEQRYVGLPLKNFTAIKVSFHTLHPDGHRCCPEPSHFLKDTVNWQPEMGNLIVLLDQVFNNVPF